MSWRDSISQSVGPAAIADIQQYVTAAIGHADSPIDTFYKASRELLTVGTPTFLTANRTMGALFLVGIVSITENYFRDIFSRIIRLCPIARAVSADQNVKLGSVVWHGGEDAERGAFEHISFASGENLIGTGKKFLDYRIRRTSVVQEFDKVCELRHGIVHSSSVLAGKNATRLHLAAASAPLRILVGFAQLQECAAICNSLVVSVNQELFVELARRWSKEWPKNPSWDPRQRHAAFRSIWEAFYSGVDAANGTIPHALTLVRCRNKVATDPF
jgi:hypothetical protein